MPTAFYCLLKWTIMSPPIIQLLKCPALPEAVHSCCEKESAFAHFSGVARKQILFIKMALSPAELELMWSFFGPALPHPLFTSQNF